MRPAEVIRNLIRGEEGSLLGNIIFFGVLIAIIAIIVIDGSSIFYASEAASEVSQEAADLALSEYQDHPQRYQRRERGRRLLRGQGPGILQFPGQHQDKVILLASPAARMQRPTFSSTSLTWRG